AKGKKDKNPVQEERREFLKSKVMAVHMMKDKVVHALKDDEMYELWKNLEIPISKVLAEMEIRGITVDASRLVEMEAEIQERLDEIEAKIHEFAGGELNINSPKQLGAQQIEKLELPVIKK